MHPRGRRFGAVAFVHRFGDVLNCHVYDHAVVTDWGAMGAGLGISQELGPPASPRAGVRPRHRRTLVSGVPVLGIFQWEVPVSFSQS
jgi:hypothetical protein